jgi:rfaE bifunctional protein nucleotidyltransferase chain/domain/rfaE bifunctional protein kinase chain/domain
MRPSPPAAENRAETRRLVVVGDTLLDRDVQGSVRRVAPDAPAPVLDEESVSDRPGGAGLAALLATGHGYDVALVTALADDAGGARLSELLTAAGIEVYALPLPGATPEKVRMRAGGQVLLRLDRGGASAAPGEPSDATLAVLRDASAILVSDYGRGVARQPRLRQAIEQAKAPVVWDPHPNGPPPVPGVRLVTPNVAEVRKLSGDAGGGSTLSVAQRAGHQLRQRWRAGAVAVTVGGDGAVLCHSGPTPLVVPAPQVSDGDTCGAGDRFAASAALALASGALVSEAVQEAVAAATAYVASGGVTAALAPERPEPDRRHRIGAEEAGRLIAEVRARGGTVVATGGCFDLLHIGHLATLEAARKLGDCLIVCLNSDASVSALKGPDRPLTRQADRARLLAALDCVDAVVVFDEPTPESVLTWLRPDVWVKGGDYADGGPEMPEAELMHRWGGQTVIVPYLDGRSTTKTIAAAQAATGR